MVELGRTRLDTRRQRARRVTGIGVGLVGAVITAWVAAAVVAWLSGAGWQWPQILLRPMVTGDSGGLLGLPQSGEAPAAPSRSQLPVTLSWPAPAWATALVAVPLWAGWVRLTVVPLLRGLQHETRHEGLASRRKIRAVLSAGTARSSGHLTRPDLPWWHRWLLSPAEFGYCFGHPIQPRTRRRLWATWQQRMRIIARTGWGKTSRLLVPIIRRLPGPAVISSTEPAIFEQTVLARQWRRSRLRWTWLDWLVQRWLPVREYPIAVVDLSPPDARFAAGYPSVRWNPITGAADYTLAYRRAQGLMAGVEDSETERGSDDNWLFRASAVDVLAAWLHAADLGDYEIADLRAWLRDTTEGRRQSLRILEDHPQADPSAADSVRKHLDPRSDRTTSSVERFVMLVMRSLLSADGQALCGRRFDDEGTRIHSFDMAGFIAAGGTLYLLADADRLEHARPLLSLFADEMFYAARQAALRCPGKRLPQSFFGVLDELRYGVTVSSLPYIGNTMRKFGIGYIYAVQESSQEDTLYGAEVTAVRAATDISIYGGLDSNSAQSLSDQAGTAPVVTASRGDHESEHVQHQQALTVADQQALAYGESVISAPELPPFLAYTPLLYEQRLLARRIQAEARQVTNIVAAAQEGQQTRSASHTSAGAAGATFRKEN